MTCGECAHWVWGALRRGRCAAERARAFSSASFRQHPTLIHKLRRRYFENTWALTDTLFCSLRDDSLFYAIPDALRRPLIFYSAHAATLYANKMHLAGLVGALRARARAAAAARADGRLPRRSHPGCPFSAAPARRRPADMIDPYFQKLFETGVDEMSWDSMEALQQEDFPWPALPAVVAFRARVKAAVLAAIAVMPHPHDVPITAASPYWSLVMGFEHERIHLETSSVLIRQLPLDAVRSLPGVRTAPTLARGSPAAAPANALLTVPATAVVIGKPRDFPSFGWDNEYGERHVSVPAFQAAAMLVSNAEFLPFVMVRARARKKGRRPRAARAAGPVTLSPRVSSPLSRRPAATRSGAGG